MAARRLLLAPFGHAALRLRRPLMGAKRTSPLGAFARFFLPFGQRRISYAILIIADGAAMAIERSWLVMHESGMFVRFTQAGADLFA